MALDHLNWRRNQSPTSRVRPPWVNHPPTPQLSYRNRNIHGRGLLRLTFHAVLQGVKRLVGSSSYQTCMVNKKSCSMHFLGDWAFFKPVTHDEWKIIKFACGKKPVKSRTCRAEHWRFEKQERSEHPQWRSAVSAVSQSRRGKNSTTAHGLFQFTCRCADGWWISWCFQVLSYWFVKQGTVSLSWLYIYRRRVLSERTMLIANLCQPSKLMNYICIYAFNCRSRLNEDIVSQCLT